MAFAWLVDSGHDKSNWTLAIKNLKEKGDGAEHIL